MKEYINNNTLVGEIVNTYPETIEVLTESISDACLVHGLDPDEVIEAVNAKINETRAEK